MAKSPEQSLAKASAEKFAAGCCCSEAILTTYGPRFGLTDELSMRMGCALGGGIGSSGNICGAVTGAILVLGLKYGRTEKTDAEKRVATDTHVQQFLKMFQAAHKHLRCNDLVGYDRSTPEGHDAAAAAGVFKNLCPRLVEDAALILEDLLEI